MGREHLPAVLDHLDAEREASLERLFALLRIPSISTEKAHAGDCRRAADHLAADLAGLGFTVETLSMPEAENGHPLVLARGGPESGPRVLFYGHYDVQPVDPLGLWDHPPFEPRVETRPDGSTLIRARGASDDKGQLMTFVEACRAWTAVAGALPIGVTILFEGEEEAGGASLPHFFERHGEALRADVALVCDTGMWSASRPAITISLRGIVTTTLSIRAASRDLHSGHFGGAARNPLALMSRILADLRDESGAVTLAGFYDGVPETPEDVRRIWDSLGFDAEAFLGQVGLSVPAGEQDRSVLEQIWARPTAEVNGVWGGYIGDGFKTVIPAEAHAKLSFRLVGEQDPAKVLAALRAHVAARMPADCDFELAEPHLAGAISQPHDGPHLKRAAAALSEEWGEETALVGVGGSIPVIADFKNRLGMDSLLVGFALEDDQIHAPNEKYELTSFEKGARSWARILAALAEEGGAS